MPAEALKCKECSETYPLEALFVCDRCFGPLEVQYDLSGLAPAETRRRIQAGPQSVWRYADFLPFEAPPRTALAAGATPRAPADRPAGRPGVRGGWGEDAAGDSPHFFQGPVGAVAHADARRLGLHVG